MEGDGRGWVWGSNIATEIAKAKKQKNPDVGYNMITMKISLEYYNFFSLQRKGDKGH